MNRVIRIKVKYLNSYFLACTGIYKWWICEEPVGGRKDECGSGDQAPGREESCPAGSQVVSGGTSPRSLHGESLWGPWTACWKSSSLEGKCSKWSH